MSRSGSPVAGGDGAGLEALEVGGAAVDGIALRRGYVGAGEHCEIIGVGPVDVDWVTSLLPEANARHVQQDHRDDYANGGPGSADNLNLLCQFHHNQKSRDGARLERHGNHWHWYPPNTTEPWRSPVGANLTLWNLDR